MQRFNPFQDCGESPHIVASHPIILYIESSQCAKYFFHMLLFGGFFEGLSFANKADNLNF